MPDSRIFVFARDDDYFFGVLQSRAHEIWSLAQASRHGVGNDPTYNNTTCFETFPLPWPPGTEPAPEPVPPSPMGRGAGGEGAFVDPTNDPATTNPTQAAIAAHQAIATAAADLDRLRTAWLNPPNTPEPELKKRTLTNFYNARPTWLANAHDALDRAVWSAYAWPDDPAATTDEQILERLLALNSNRAKS